jgi:hypothetical protein
MSIGMFVLFSVVLAYQSWQQSRSVPVAKNAPDAESHPEAHETIPA